MNVSIKPFTLNDENYLLKIRNQKSTRLNSLNKSIILKKDHLNWLKKFKKNKKNKIYIIYLSSLKIGYIRLDWIDFCYFLSLALDEKFQSKGIAGKSMLELEKKFKTIRLVISKVKSSNISSITLFKSSGYSLIFTDNKILYFSKIYKFSTSLLKSLEIINEIEKVRKGNNLNWMDILRLSFKSDLEQSKKIFKKINSSDKKINNLSQKLSK